MIFSGQWCRTGIGLGVLMTLLLVLPASAIVPNDPFAEQWAYDRVSAYKAWDITTGSSDVVVAIIDNGFDHMHPDLLDNVWVNIDEIPDNGVDDDENGYIDDIYGWDFVSKDRDGDGVETDAETFGDNDPRPQVDEADISDNPEKIHHGTVVAGIIGAVGNNKTDGVGLAWDVQLMNIRYIDNTGIGTFGRLHEAIRYAVDNGADIINLSLVGPEWSDKLERALDYAYEQGVTVVAAAGNSRRFLDEDPVYPVCADANTDVEKVIGISAIIQDRRGATFSNIGAACIDIAAPGVDIASTERFAPSQGYPNQYGGGWDGTSFAAPIVSGIAALVKSIQPLWGPKEIFEALTISTSVTPGQDPDIYAALFGAGLVQADAAVAYALAQGGALDKDTLTLISDLLAIFDNGQVGPVTDNASFYRLEYGAQGVEHVTSYKDGNSRRYVTTHFDPVAQEVLVSFYDQSWNAVRSWTVPSDAPLDIAIGDVLGTDKEEIILVPSGPSAIHLMVYTRVGREVKTIIKSERHQGGAVALGDEQTDGRYPLYVLTTQTDGGIVVDHFNDALEIVSSSSLVFPASGIPSLAVGTFGAEKRIALGAPAGSVPFVGLYKEDGTFVNTFFGESVAMTSGIDVVIRSGMLVTIPQTVGRPIGIWDKNGIRKGEPLRLPGSVQNGANRLFVVSK